ncbi:MAG: hypothetical protein KatS3mg023_2710 [Armatimonadota bacterium]|nr:MAG: hypothetical protein KatS3mg023_2710 [Armatimonadota bacterium]
MRKGSRERWVLFYSTPNVMEGNIILDLLRSAGVKVLARTLGHVYVTWGMEILVPQEQLQQAQQVFAEAKETNESEEGDNGHHGE